MNSQETPPEDEQSSAPTTANESAAAEPKPRRARLPKVAAVSAEPAIELETSPLEVGLLERTVSTSRARKPKLLAPDPAPSLSFAAPIGAPAAVLETVSTESLPELGVVADIPPAQAPVFFTSPVGQANDVDTDDDDDDRLPPPPRLEARDVGEVFAQVVSGEFDGGEVETALPPLPAKRVLLPDLDAPKLHKVLAQAGIGSRRDMEQLIANGAVVVNGHLAHTGQRISFGDQIKVEGKPVRVHITPPPPRIIAYHKPAGEVVTHDDPQHRPTVFRRLPRLSKGKWQSVGRLDINTEGLLLFTNSGELANQLMHPRFGVEREYAVRVLGTLESEAKAKLLAGVEIEGQMASFRSVLEGGGEGVNRWYKVVITEGRNREVRRLFDAVGLTVNRLIRIRYGTVVLPRGLKRGVWVDLAQEDVQVIRQLTGNGMVVPGGRPARDVRHRKGKPLRSSEAAPQGRRVQPDRPAPRVQVAAPRRDDSDDDFDPRQIPNPLEQTFDKRFVQNPRTPAGGRGFRHGGGGFGSGGSAPPPRKAGGPREPDPLQTSMGYIGADAFHRKSRGGGGGGGNGSGGGRSGGQRGGSGGFGGKRGR